MIKRAIFFPLILLLVSSYNSFATTEDIQKSPKDLRATISLEPQDSPYFGGDLVVKFNVPESAGFKLKTNPVSVRIKDLTKAYRTLGFVSGIDGANTIVKQVIIPLWITFDNEFDTAPDVLFSMNSCAYESGMVMNEGPIFTISFGYTSSQSIFKKEMLIDFKAIVVANADGGFSGAINSLLHDFRFTFTAQEPQGPVVG